MHYKKMYMLMEMEEGKECLGVVAWRDKVFGFLIYTFIAIFHSASHRVFCIAKCMEIASKHKYHYLCGPENIISRAYTRVHVWGSALRFQLIIQDTLFCLFFLSCRVLSKRSYQMQFFVTCITQSNLKFIILHHAYITTLGGNCF